MSSGQTLVTGIRQIPGLRVKAKSDRPDWQLAGAIGRCVVLLANLPQCRIGGFVDLELEDPNARWMLGDEVAPSGRLRDLGIVAESLRGEKRTERTLIRELALALARFVRSVRELRIERLEPLEEFLPFSNAQLGAVRS